METEMNAGGIYGFEELVFSCYIGETIVVTIWVLT